MYIYNMNITKKDESKLSHKGKQTWQTYKFRAYDKNGNKYIFKHRQAAQNFHNKINNIK